MSYNFEDMFTKDFVLSAPSKPGHSRYYVNAVGERRQERDEKVWELFEEAYNDSYVPSVYVEVRDGEPLVDAYPGSQVRFLPGVKSVIREHFREKFGNKLN